MDGFLGINSWKWNYCNSSFSSFPKSYNMVITVSCNYKVLNQQSKIAPEMSGIEGFWSLSDFLSQYFIYLNLAISPKKFSFHLYFSMYLHTTMQNLFFNYLNLHVCDYIDLSFYSHLFYIFFLIRFSEVISLIFCFCKASVFRCTCLFYFSLFSVLLSL